MRRWVVIVGLLLMPTLVSAATIYVDGGCGNVSTYVPATRACTGGSDVSRPTIQLAHDLAAFTAPSTIYVRSGTYTLSALTWLTKSGSAGNLLRLEGYPGDAMPVIDGASLSGSGNDRWCLYTTSSYWYIKGLELKNAPGSGIRVSDPGSNITIEGLVVHHNVRLEANGAGIELTTNGANFLILNNDAHHQTQVTPCPGTCTGGDGINAAENLTSSVVVRGNRSWRNNDDGFDFSWSIGVLAEQNWSWENGFNDALTPSGGDGVGYKLGLLPDVSHPNNGAHTIRNNLSWRNRKDGFHQNAANTVMFLYNNTAWENNQSGAYNYNFPQAGTAHVLRNNISLTPNSPSLNASIVDDHNTWDTAVTVTTGDFVTTSFTANTGARQADGSLPVSTFLHLASGSDLIDQGVDVGLPFTGSAPDLGAFEFAAAASSTGNARYHLDEGTGPTADDSLDGTFDGTWQGSPTAITGKVSGALRFNGTTQYVSATSPNLGASLSLAAWVRVSTLVPAVQDLLANFNAGATLGTQYEIGILSNGAWFYGYSDGATARQFTSAVSAIPVDTWVHLAVRDDGADGVILYQAGSPISSTPSGTPMSKPTSAPGLLGLGRGGSYNGQYLTGDLDEVYVRATVMSPAEIAALAAEGTDITPPAAPTNLRVVSP